MTHESILSPGFSWQRLQMVARFYYPCLRLPLILYPTIAAVVGFLEAWLMQSVIGMAISALPSMLISFMFYLFPLFFARPKSPAVETMLPATSTEKATFFVGMCLIVNPILIYVPQYLTNYLASFFFTSPIQDGINELSFEMICQTYGFSFFQAFPPLATCMYVVFSRWRNRMGTAIGLTIATLVAITLIGAIYGVIMAFTDSSFMQMVKAGDTGTYDAGVKFGQDFASSMKSMVFVVGGLSLLYTILMAWLTFRKIRTLQV